MVVVTSLGHKLLTNHTNAEWLWNQRCFYGNTVAVQHAMHFWLPVLCLLPIPICSQFHQTANENQFLQLSIPCPYLLIKHPILVLVIQYKN